MLKKNVCVCALVMAAMAAVFCASSFAAPPVVKTVRADASNALVPHNVISGAATRLKGTSDVPGAGITYQYSWDFGDASAPTAFANVSNPYIIEAGHTYTGSAGDVFIAKLTVKNLTTSESTTANYPIQIGPNTLPTRVNIAIDEGLWYLHKYQTRSTSSGVAIGYWNSGYAGSGYQSVSASNVNAFEVSGFLQTGPPGDPYTETVSRGLNYLFLTLSSYSIGPQTNGLGTFNPDSNGNGIGLYMTQGYPFYQGGQLVDAIVASGTPNAIAPLGGPNVIGRTYKEIVQDMVDFFAFGQYDYAPAAGGWRYNANEWPDNSACQWVAIGIIAASRQWGIVLPQIVKDWNMTWLTYSQGAYSTFGYTDPGYYPYGPYATTPSGMVQLTMDGRGRGNTMWEKAETYMRNNFGNGGGAGSAPKDYYYGLFSFTKAMLLHDSNADNVAEPLKLLRSSTAGVGYLKWYDAEAGIDQGVSEAETGIPAGIPLGIAPTHGVARTLVDEQNSNGYWYGHNASGEQYPFETAWAIIMLRRTVVDIPPTARAKAIPNPTMATLPVTFDGSTSTAAQNKQIVKWEWDLDNNGTFETLGISATRSFPTDGSFQVTLQVTDSHNLTDTDTITVVVQPPPVAPTAKAGGPYNFCMNRTPWILHGSAVNPDEGLSEPGQPGNTIIAEAWDLDGDNDFTDASGYTPDIAGLLGVGDYLIQFRVTDNSAVSHPSFPQGNLSATDTAYLHILAADSIACTGCQNNLAARAKPTKVDLTWDWRVGAHYYNVYRATLTGGPYLKIGTTSAPGLPGKGVYADFGLVNGTTYYYVVREAALNNDELCQSNQASAKPMAR